MLYTIPEIIEKSWLLYVKHLKQLWLYLLLFFLLSPLFSLLFLSLVTIHGVLFAHGAGLALFLPVDIILGLAFLIAYILIYYFVFVSFCQTIKQLFDGTAVTSFLTSLKLNKLLVVSTAWVAIIVGLVILGGSLLLLIPGLIFTIWYVFSVNEAIFEGKIAGSALRVSKQLVVGRWWTILFRVVIPPLIFVIATVLLQFIISWLAYAFLSQGAADVLSAITSTLLNAFLVPLLTVCNLVLYFSAKTSQPVAVTPATIKTV